MISIRRFCPRPILESWSRREATIIRLKIHLSSIASLSQFRVLGHAKINVEAGHFPLGGYCEKTHGLPSASVPKPVVQTAWGLITLATLEQLLSCRFMAISRIDWLRKFRLDVGHQATLKI